MKTVQQGDMVKVHYTGKLDNGDIFDSSRDRAPLEVTIGQGQLIEGFERALIGMAVNESKDVRLSPQEAYGERDEEAMRTLDRDEVPAGLEIEVGQMVSLRTPQDRRVPAKVVHMDDSSITLDLNHPLAGETLNFSLEVVAID